MDSPQEPRQQETLQTTEIALSKNCTVRVQYSRNLTSAFSLSVLQF